MKSPLGELSVKYCIVLYLLTLIHWIAIYLVDSVNQPSNNWDQTARSGGERTNNHK